MLTPIEAGILGILFFYVCFLFVNAFNKRGGSDPQQLERFHQGYCSECLHDGQGDRICAVQACVECFARENVIRHIVPERSDASLHCLMFVSKGRG